ncbi:MAG: transporter [Prevotella sp.]|nr:transporter [Prevotella sp.]
MKHKTIICLLSLFIPCIGMQAQDITEFSPDSPGATTGPGIMPQWKVDWETGTAHEWNRRNGVHERTWLINTSTLRLGLTDNTELRLQMDESATHTPENHYTGISTAAIGTKIKIAEGKGAMPAISFLGTLLLPGGSHSHYLPQHVGIQTHLLFENTLNNSLTLGYDIGAEWSGDTDNPDVFFGACLTYEATDKLSLFAESYNLYNSQQQDDWAKPGHSSHFNCMSEIGAAYIVSPRLQVNLYGDFNLNEPSKYANLGFGLAWLLN